MIIRSEQMETLAYHSLVERTVDHLLANYPRESSRYSRAELVDLVTASFRRAEGYGMSADQSLQAFAALSLTISPQFDEHPRIRKILLDAAVPPDLRVNLLGECTIDRDWEEARKLNNAKDS